MPTIQGASWDLASEYPAADSPELGADRAKDGSVRGVANPVLMEAAPSRRIYWGDTHGHSGFAEGVGAPERFMVWVRDDSRLDFVTHSEHDIWMDDFEWNVLRENVRRFSQSPRLPRSPEQPEDRSFVAFLGYEWTTKNTQGGHHNVLFRTPDGRKRIPAQEYGTLSALYQSSDDRVRVEIPLNMQSSSRTNAHSFRCRHQNSPSAHPTD